MEIRHTLALVVCLKMTRSRNGRACSIDQVCEWYRRPEPIDFAIQNNFVAVNSNSLCLHDFPNVLVLAKQAIIRHKKRVFKT